MMVLLRSFFSSSSISFRRWQLTPPTIAVDVSISPFISFRLVSCILNIWLSVCVTHSELLSLVCLLIFHHTIMSLSVPGNFLCFELFFFDMIIVTNLFEKKNAYMMYLFSILLLSTSLGHYVWREFCFVL